MATPAMPLLSREALAALVSDVTRTLLGIQLVPDLASPARRARDPRGAVLVLPGPRPLTVALAADAPACLTLAGAMFSCRPHQVDASMIDDAIAEMVNIVAGATRAALGLDQPLGLPRLVADAAALMADESRWRSARLGQSGRPALLWVALGERAPQAGREEWER